MASSAAPNFDPMALARQIIDLDAELHAEVMAARYERAAALRDQLEALKRQIENLGDPIVVQNTKNLISTAWLPPGLTRGPLLSLLEQVESKLNPELLQLMSTAPLPPRWILHAAEGSCRATVGRRLNLDSLDSPYFQALLPVFNSATLGKATYPMEWFTAAVRETARATWRVIWIVQEPAFLDKLGLLDAITQFLSVPATQFVVHLQKSDEAFALRFGEIPGSSVIRA